MKRLNGHAGGSTVIDKSSPSSSPIVAALVNEERPPRGHLATSGSLLRRLLRAERRARLHRPRQPIAGPIPKPERTDEVLEILARVYKPGDRVGRPQMVAAAGISRTTAHLVQRWAKAAGLWPYAKPLTGFSALADRRRKGGAL